MRVVNNVISSASAKAPADKHIPNGEGLMKKTLEMMLIFAFTLILPLTAAAFKADGSSLINDAGAPVRMTVLNVPYMAIMTKAEMDTAYAAAAAAGFKAVRIYGSFAGEKTYALQTKPGVYNEAAFAALDYAVSAASKNNLKLIVSLGDSSGGYGGKEVYSQWAGGSNDDVFFKDVISKNCFKKFVSYLLERKNKITGFYYKEEPVVLAWDLCAETDNKNDDTGRITYDWIKEMSQFVKGIDSLHLVTVNMKKLAIDDGQVNTYDIFKLPSLDMVFYSITADKNMPPDSALNYVRSYGSAFYQYVNKPVALAFRDTASGEKQSLYQPARTFFESRGSLFIFDAAAFGGYKNSSGINDMNTPAVKAELIKVSELAGKYNSKIASLSLNSVKIEPGTGSAQISVNLPERASAEIVYGEAEPLKTKVKFPEGMNIVTIDGLKSDTVYKVLVSASGNSLAGVSKETVFRTLVPKRLTAKPFTRSNNFITVKGTDFYDGSRVYKYLGSSNYYIRSLKKEKVDYIFKEAAKIGFKVIRVGSNGEAFNASEAVSEDKTRYFRIGPDVFNETAYKALDYVIDSAARNGMRVILHFTDNWEYYGGVNVYAKWAGVTKNGFWTNEQCKTYYKQTVDSIVNRKNTVNGKLYKEDPTILAYDLLNEPRNENDVTGKELTAWAAEMSAYIKGLAPKQLVTSGSEGAFLKSDGTHYAGSDYIGLHQAPSIDFCSYHVYPASTYNNFSLATTKWLIEKWVKTAHETIKKPVVMEEYGIPWGLNDFPKAKWLDAMTADFFNAGGNGANYWMFIDPEYAFGDGNQISPKDTECVNSFIKHANIINKGGY